MSYNVYLAGLHMVGSVAAAGGEPTVVLLPGDERYRLTVPHLSVRCGTSAETMTVMSPVEFVSTAAESDGASLTLKEPMESLIENHYLAFQLRNGHMVVDTVQSVSVDGEVMTITLATEPEEPVAAGTRVYRFGDTDVPGHFQTTLSADAETEFEAPAPGRFVAGDYGFPFIVHITNSDDQAVFLDAVCAYIDV